MNADGQKLVATVWERLTGEAFTVGKFVAQVRHFGGHDISALSDDDIEALFYGQFSGDWHEVAFAFSETLAASSIDLGDWYTTSWDSVWVFCVLVVAECLDRDETEMEFQFGKFVGGFDRLRASLREAEWMDLFERFFTRADPPQGYVPRAPSTPGEIYDRLAEIHLGEPGKSEVYEKLAELSRQFSAVADDAISADGTKNDKRREKLLGQMLRLLAEHLSGDRRSASDERGA